jgi:hypothetical protein
MSYHFTQAILTVLFDGVALSGIVFILIACGWESVRRQQQQPLALPAPQSPVLNLTPYPQPILLEAREEEVLEDLAEPVPLKSSSYQYLSA